MDAEFGDRCDFAVTAGPVELIDRSRGSQALRHGLVVGLTTQAENERLLRELSPRARPSLRDLPWAAINRTSDGRVVATCSMMHTSGLFYAVEPDGQHLHVATDPLSVARSLQSFPSVDDEFLESFASAQCAPERTAFVGVHRFPSGITLSWRPGGKPELFDWFSPQNLPSPSLDDYDAVIAGYVETFDSVTRELARRAGPLIATLSGGLDSTFVAASILTDDQLGPLTGLCHSPLPQANAPRVGKFDPDDYPLARLMEDRYPGRLTVKPLRNEAMIHPLDAASARCTTNGVPILGPKNAVWLGDVARMAAAAGARVQFHGSSGNASFSADHGYAARYYWQGRHPLKLLSLVRGRSANASLRGAFKRRILLPLQQAEMRSEPLDDGFIKRTEAQRAANSRALFVQWMASRRTGFLAAHAPSRETGSHIADPFSSESVVEFAASVEPRQWQLGDDSRSLARALGRDRIPDEIRLRRRRGGQGLDAWYVIAQQPKRMERGIECVADTPQFAEWVDVDRLRQWWREALQGGPHQYPVEPVLGQALRIIGLAEFRAAISAN